MSNPLVSLALIRILANRTKENEYTEKNGSYFIDVTFYKNKQRINFCFKKKIDAFNYVRKLKCGSYFQIYEMNNLISCGII